jgi:dTDP-4-dehydrorhamnose reductase
MSATIVIVGASGLVGGALAREFGRYHRVIGTFYRNPGPNLVHLDLQDPGEVLSMLRKIRADVVLCPAAQPNVELCEIDPTATRRVNIEGLQNLIVAAVEIDATLVYFSSEYVFDGAKGSYCEGDVCLPLNEYGRQKLESEYMITTQLSRYIIGRVSGVYDWEKQKRNFVVRLIESLESGQSVKVPLDQLITPTYAPNLAQIVRLLVEGGHKGVLHLAGPVSLPRIDFARTIADVFDLDASLIMPVRTSELKLRAVRPYGAGLSTAKVRDLLDLPLATPLDGLRAMRDSQYSGQNAAGLS